MSSSKREEGGISGILSQLLDKPILKYVATTVALLAGIGKIIEFLGKPGFPDWAKVMLWVVLGLSLLLLALLVFISYTKRLVKRLITETESEPKETPDEEIAGEVTYVFNSQRYGVAYEDLKAHCTIREDGSATFRREIGLLAHSTVSKTEGYMVLPEAPKNSEDRLKFPQVESLDEFREVHPEVDKLSSGELHLKVFFSPELDPGQRTRYQVTEESGVGLYAVTGREERQMPYDYFGWDITIPTKKLEMKVFFPEGFRPQSYTHNVWYAWAVGRATHGQEHARIKDSLTEGQAGSFRTLALVVPYPVLGMTYVIQWVPPGVQ